MKLSECKSFEDLKAFCEFTPFYYIDGNGNAVRLGVKDDTTEFIFDRKKGRMSWKDGSTYGDELYNNCCEAELAKIRLAIIIREDAVRRMTREIEQLKQKEPGLVSQAEDFRQKERELIAAARGSEDDDGAGKED